MSGTFLFLMRPGGGPVDPEVRQTFDAACSRNEIPALNWKSEANWAVGLGDDVGGAGTGPALSSFGSHVITGNARLDNRHELLSWAEPPRRPATTELDVVAAAIRARGLDCIPRILGDFGFVVWDPIRRELLGARDPFGVNGLYFTERPDLVAIASRAGILAEQEEYDREYLLDFLIGEFPELTRTPFNKVYAVAPGTIWRWRTDHSSATRFWSPDDFPIDHGIQPGHAIEEFRSLFTQAVANCLAPGDGVWAELSGGLDSSSVVSVAQSLAAAGGRWQGLSGTVTVVDSIGAGDERQYVAEVLRRYPVQNTEITDFGMWQDTGCAAPMVDRPYPAYPFFARDLEMVGAVRESGCRIVFSGQGADHYLTGSLLYVADLVQSRRTRQAVREVHRWASVLRSSFWRLGFQYGMAPLLPSILRRGSLAQDEVPRWIAPAILPRKDLTRRTAELRQNRRSNGSHYAGRIAHLVKNIPWVADRPLHSSFVETRYPFLYRPLVEFSLRLPPQLRSRPRERKWILRQAMSEIVPSKVLQRCGKGGVAARAIWSLQRERARVDLLMNVPILDQLGLVDPQGLRSSVLAAQQGRSDINISALSALTLETWLQVRSGRWTNQVPVQDPQRAIPLASVR